ncbi:hypothetical protein H3S84_02555 [Bartonella sp. W8098]|uniref:hypothetical protein n=1 Tax=Bartonella TaxID=773 RepID=UPI0018DB9A4A|nr:MULTISPECIES: hypothetical protein [Bartonella]MBH9987154.1 hypothetical protein [Bartonella apis]MBI0170797.1 hypothetical protein [Bartonella sp. W8151]
MRFLLVLSALLFSISPVFSQSVSEVIGHDSQNNKKSADVTVFVFAYSMLKESDKVFMPMIEEPANSMMKVCKKPTNKAKQWVYMNIVQQYDHILKEVYQLEKGLSINGKAEPGPAASRMTTTLSQRRDMMETARALDLSAEVVEVRMEANDALMDKALIETGDTVASSAFDTFKETNTAKIKSVPQDIGKMLQDNCLKDPGGEENFITSPAQ